MSSSKSEPADIGVSFDRLVEMFQSLSLKNRITTSSIGPAEPPALTSAPTSSAVDRVWKGNPLEVLAPILLQSFFSNFDDKEDLALTPSDPQPDLTLMKVNEKCRHFFEQKLLPDSVMIVVNSHVCSECAGRPMNRHPGHASLFNRSTKQPWATMARRTSNITMTIRCDTADVVDSYTIGTLYVPRNRLNILLLSQTLLGGARRSIHPQLRVIDVHCHPRNLKGATMCAEVLLYLGNFLHGATNGARTIAGDPDLREAIEAALQKPYPTFTTWVQASDTHQNFLRECQYLLDSETVAIHQVAEVAAAAFRNFDSRSDPFPTRRRRVLPQDELEEFMYKDIDGGCMLFLVFHGLSSFSHRHYLSTTSEYWQPVNKTNFRFEDLKFDEFGHRMRTMEYLCYLQDQGMFRNWALADVPYVLHLCAMLQMFLRYRIIRFAQEVTYPFRRTLRGGHGGHFRQVCDELLRYVHYLEQLEMQIMYFHDISEDKTAFTMIDGYELQAFVAGMRTLLLDIRNGAQGKTEEEWYASFDTSVFNIPAKIHIPVIAASEWDSVRQTYQELNNFGLWWDQRSWLDQIDAW